MTGPSPEPAGRVRERRQLPGPVLACTDLTVRFPDRRRPAVRGITLSLERGERLLVLGPSGSGKSTLAYALSGIIPRSLDAEVSGRVQRPQRVGVLFQDPEAQFCLFTVADEIAFSLENRAIEPARMPARIAEVLAAVGLEVPLEQPIATLSGGMKQRWALAAVLALEPDVLFLDEPTAQLDPAGTERVLAAVRQTAVGRTIFLIEHRLDGVIDWVDRVVLLTPDGRLLDDGPPATILRGREPEIRRYGIWWPRAWRSPWADLNAPAPAPAASVGTQTPAAPEEPLVELLGCSVAYGGRPVWQGVNLRISAGEWIAVVGVNGSGKSTFLRLLAGLLRPGAGEVRFHTGLRGRGRDLPAVAYVFQNPEHQFVTDRVRDEVAFAARVAGWPEPRIRAETERLLAEFGLSDLADANPFALSEGQKRRLSVAGALIVPHRLLLLDEPTFGQDARTARAIVEHLAKRHRQGATIVMATHDLDLAAQVASRLLVFGSGRLIYDGPPRAFLDDPDRRRRAGLDPAAAPGPGPDAEMAEMTPPTGPPGAGRRQDKPHAVSLATPRPVARPPLARVNPTVKLLAHLVAMLALLAVDQPATMLALALVPVVAGLAFGRLRPWALARRLAPFLLVGGSSFWVLAAYGEGTSVLWQGAWWRVTAEGLHNGLNAGLRLVAFGAYGAVFAMSTDLTELVLSLMQQLRLSPRWAYGVLAGLRFVPLWHAELEQLRTAHRVRGYHRLPGLRRRLDALRRLAIPLLAQAVRRAERVAIALEARGFDGSRRRTFFRRLAPGAVDLAYLAVLAALSLGAWLLTRSAG
ncbi:MAG TPA: ATP-binding cassette domain-containing protein [Bacillota bacterium]